MFWKLYNIVECLNEKEYMDLTNMIFENSK